MDEPLVTEEQLNGVGFLLDSMTIGQLHMVRNKIDQIIFERALHGKSDFAIKVEKDELSPFGIRVEIPKELQDAIQKSAENLKKSLESLKSLDYTIERIPDEIPGKSVDEPTE